MSRLDVNSGAVEEDIFIEIELLLWWGSEILIMMHLEEFSRPAALFHIFVGKFDVLSIYWIQDSATFYAVIFSIHDSFFLLHFWIFNLIEAYVTTFKLGQS